MKIEKRISALEQIQEGRKLLFPGFLLSGLPEHLLEFHNNGKMAQHCTLSEAGKAVVTNSVYDLIKAKYHEAN